MSSTKKGVAQRGRPRTSVRTRQIQVRLSPDELDDLVETARSAGLPLSTWIRLIILPHRALEILKGK